MVYLDNNATTRPSEAVAQAVLAGVREHWENPSSVHRAGQRVRAQVELAREATAGLIDAKPREITFTSGGTESIDLAVRGSLARTDRRVLATTRVEHAAVRDLALELAADGVEVRWLPLTDTGVVDLNSVRGLVGGAGLVSVQWANNETGVVQPVREIARLAREAGARVHIDGTQWVGKMPASVAAGWCDLLTFSPHKFHGPKGVGVLWVRRGLGLKPRLVGTQELGRRGGTENVPGILGAGVAAREAAAWVMDAGARERLALLRDRFERSVVAACPGAVVNGAGSERLWNTSNIGFPRLEAEALLMLLSERGVCASAGAACSSGSLEPSPVLLAMGVPPEVAHGSVRFSLSRESTEAEVMEAAGVVAACVGVLSARTG
ncbi:MAG: cysteine desulfurase NifS [Phycisphaerae bacterium]|nr:MAG: cysteine desulfurase NifS [Phycisphaerae bacterium]